MMYIQRMQNACMSHSYMILLELRFLEAIYMMKDSEAVGERGDFKLYLMAQRISSLLYTFTHATGCVMWANVGIKLWLHVAALGRYVRLTVEERIKWACASEAEKLCHELFMFTKLTSKGASIFSDRWFEWTQHDVRRFHGAVILPIHRWMEWALRDCMAVCRGKLACMDN